MSAGPCGCRLSATAWPSAFYPRRICTAFSAWNRMPATGRFSPCCTLPASASANCADSAGGTCSPTEMAARSRSSAKAAKHGRFRYRLRFGDWSGLCEVTRPNPAIRSSAPGRGKNGGFLRPAAVLRIVRQSALRAGIELPVSPHWFRHAHASHALDRGAPIHLVQATLGHASITTTGRYLHARPNDSSSRFLPL